MSLWHARHKTDLARHLYAAFALAVPLVLVALLTSGLRFAGQTDELKFHWDVVRQFGDALPAVPWTDYHAATTPLPYILWGAWGRLLGYDLPVLRALTLLMSFAGVWAFYGVAHRQGDRGALAESLLLLLSPYLFLNSFTVYTVNMGLLFQVLALGCYLGADRSGWRGLWWGGLAATAAMYCRQHYAFLPAGMGLWWLWRLVRRGRPAWGDLRDLLLILLPIGLFAPLALAWGGLTPPDFQSLHPLHVRLEHIHFLLVLMGLYCAPAGLVAWPTVARWGWRSLALLLAGPTYALCPPTFGTEAAASSEQGIIQHGLDLARGAVGRPLPALAQFALWANGLVIGVAALLRPAPGERSADRRVMLAGWLVAFAGILLVSDFVGERFYALIMPVLILAVYPLVVGRRVLIAAWLAGMAALGGAYALIKM